MYQFAGRFLVDMIPNADWQRAMENSALKLIEISTATRPDDELARLVASTILRMQKQGTARAGSLHLPFGKTINLASDDEEMRRSSVAGAIEYINIFRELAIPNITVHCSNVTLCCAVSVSRMPICFRS